MNTYSSTRRLVGIVATLSVLATLLAAACPTCEPQAHSLTAAAATGCCDTGARVNDWQTAAEGCACCESAACTDPAELPDGVLTRLAPLAATAAVTGCTSLFQPETPQVEASLLHYVRPPGHPRLHVEHQSFRC